MSLGREWGLDEEEARFLEYLIGNFSDPESPNEEAGAIFSAIQYSFDGTGNGELVGVHPYLLHNLAACAVLALEYVCDEKIPWDRLGHDAVIVRTFRGFVFTLVEAIKEGRVEDWEGGGAHHYAFPIPDWFVEWAKGWE